MDMAKMKILLVDDQKLFVNALKGYLEHVLEDLERILVANSGTEAVSMIEKERPDLILIDVFMPDMNGVQLAQLIHNKYPDIKMLMLTNFDDHNYVFDAMQHGASGYLLKEEIDEQQLILAIKSTIGGMMSISPDALKNLLKSEEHTEAKTEEAQDNAPELPPWFRLLSIKEKRILKLVLEGLSNKEIGEHVFLSQQTVKNYTSRIYSKLNVRNRTEAIKTAWEYASRDIW